MDRVTYEIEINSGNALYTVQASLCSYIDIDPETGGATPRREWVEIDSVGAEFFWSQIGRAPALAAGWALRARARRGGKATRREVLPGPALDAFRTEYAAEVEDKLRGKMESAWEAFAERTGACG